MICGEILWKTLSGIEWVGEVYSFDSLINLSSWLKEGGLNTSNLQFGGVGTILGIIFF